MSQPPAKLGKYEIRKELGKGAMGVVYLAYDPVLEREVALKVMASTILQDDDLKSRFEREAKAVAKLQHPNIVTVYDLGSDDQGAPFIAMELLKGTDLEQRIRKNPPSLPEKLSIVADACRGLAHAHQNGIVHRDVKPANIFVTETGGTKIMDFGVARWTQSAQTQSGSVMGTADYMSPEQIRGQKVDGKSDIFSVGVILYRLLTHKKPFVGENIQAVFYKILNADTPELTIPDGSVMPELQQIVDRALAKEVDDRYQTADELADDLTGFLRMYEGSLSQDTIFGTGYEMEAEPPTGSRAGTSGTGRRSTLRPGTDIGRTGRQHGTSPSLSRTHRPGSGTGGSATALRRTPDVTSPARGTGTHVLPPHSIPGTQVSPATWGSKGYPRPVVTQKPERSPWLLVVGAVVVLAALGAGGYYYLGIGPAGDTTPNGKVAPEPTPSPEQDIQGRLAFAEGLLEKGRINDAYEAVDRVLEIAPENAEALALREKIMNAPAKEVERAIVPNLPEPVRPIPEPRPPRAGDNKKSPSILAADKAFEAAIAINQGDLAKAQVLITEGEHIDPSNPQWSKLNRQLDARRRETENKSAADQQKTGLVAAHLRSAAEFMVAQDYAQAIASYKRALDQDPQNPIALQGLGDASKLQAQLNAQRSVQRIINQSATSFVPASSKKSASGFMPDESVNAKKATGAPDFAAEIIIELNPPNAQPGQLYELIVRLSNTGQRTIKLKSLEIVHNYAGKPPIGQGLPIPLATRIVPGNGIGLLHQVQSKWTEDQNKGKIEAIVTLDGDDKLVKSITW